MKKMREISMTPEQAFKLTYKAKIKRTGNKVLVPPEVAFLDPLSVRDTLLDITVDEIAITMSEPEYMRLLAHRNDLNMIQVAIATNPIAKDMYMKLLTYINLL